jgi:glyoxylase-like metal-dependent hydrolase (beta-lactamase superfamily II)
MERFAVGDFDCMLFGAGQFDMAGRVVFASAPEDELAAARERFDCPTDPITFQVHPLYVDTGEHRVIVDPGTTEDSRWLTWELTRAGIEPTSIDTVIITHGHADHWSSSIVDGAPAFPNARYYIQRKDWEHWFTDPNPEPDHAETFQVLVGPIADRFTFLDGFGPIVPGLDGWPTPGHSPGHMVVMIGDAAVHVGDLLLHPICAEHPDWTAGFDVWPDEVVRSRRALVDHIVEEGLLVITHHFAWPGYGHIRCVDDELRWESARVPAALAL